MEDEEVRQGTYEADWFFYVTNGRFASIAILVIDSPLHRLWRSFPPLGDAGRKCLESLHSKVQFAPSGPSGQLSDRGELSCFPIVSFVS